LSFEPFGESRDLRGKQIDLLCLDLDCLPERLHLTGEVLCVRGGGGKRRQGKGGSVQEGNPDTHHPILHIFTRHGKWHLRGNAPCIFCVLKSPPSLQSADALGIVSHA
jgi:hypothetical protein